MPARRFFQIHLSTAVILMFAAGLLIRANVRKSAVSTVVTLQVSETLAAKGGVERVFRTAKSERGWPLVYQREYSYLKYVTGERAERPPHSSELIAKRAVIDALYAAVMLLAICFLCEWRIRRRS